MGRCITTCTGLRDGDYQSCNGCQVYATCYKGQLFDNRPCPSGFVWDDIQKRCAYTSTTCPEKDTYGSTTSTGPACIRDCIGRQQIDYQSCKGCRIYATCASGGILIDNRPCAQKDTFWDDKRKACVYKSSTCTDTSTGPTTPIEPPPRTTTRRPPPPKTTTQTPGGCKGYCKGKRNGDYPSCAFDCHHYATCDNDRLTDGRDCPAGLFWDDRRKDCNYHCYPGGGTGSTTPHITPSPTTPPTAPPGPCINYCKGKRNGDYPSCAFDCHHYATCDNDRLTDGRDCPAGLFWDDRRKDCNYHCYPGGGTGSTTPHITPSPTTPPTAPPGPCINYCKGKRNGDYPSCAFDCHHYATCDNDRLTDGRDCPAGLFWDDRRKDCNYHCYPGTVTGSTTPHITPSPTTPPTAPPGPCINYCKGKRNGDYPSCAFDCHHYATCDNDRLTDGRDCPAGLFWDDRRKDCNYHCYPGTVTGSTTPHITPSPTTPPTAPPGPCINYCKGKRNGDYPSCAFDCHHYATCDNDRLTDGRDCPAGLFWDDRRKDCNYHCYPGTVTGSTTPHITPSPTTPPTAPPGPCINYCKGKRNGDYPSCAFDCHHYATCDNDRLTDGRDCPAGLFWDDRRKDCNYHCYPGGGTGSTTPHITPSPTTPPTAPPGPCINYCKGKRNGDYPSCAFDCHHYATCDNDRLTDGRDCPAGLFWDDRRKDCNYHCYPGTVTGSTTPHITPSPTTPPTAPPGPCINYCKGKRNGDYPSCAFDCHHYATCDNDRLTDGRDCPAGLFWDDRRKACNYHCYPGGGTGPDPTPASTGPPSPTPSTQKPPTTPHSHCKDYCDGKRNIDYPSCAFNCSYYATCDNGRVIDGRPCPAGLFWDDQRKACNYHCYPPPTTPITPPTTTPPTTPSTTPSTTPTPPGPCINYCKGKRNINYPACAFNCSYYATCDNDRLIDGRPCPAGLFWDDQRKACNYHCYPPPTTPITPPTTTPPTSTPEGSTPTKEPSTTTPCPTTPPLPLPIEPCVDCCDNKPDGNYHSCKNCHEYVVCSSGRLISRIECPPGKAWDDKLKDSVKSSSTCKDPGYDECICSCTNRLDGHYASCEGSGYFATCLRQILYDKLECPGGYHWSGKHRRCVD